MRFGHVDRTKETVLTELAATLARLLTRDGNRVGAVLYDNAVERIVEPRGGRSQVLRLARDLLTPSARAPGRRPTWAGCSEPGTATIRRRSLVFVALRLHQRTGLGARARAAGAAPRGRRGPALGPARGRAVDAGVVVMQDAETGEQLLVDTSDPRFRQRFADVAAARDEELRSSIRRAGVDLYDLSTDDDLVRVLLRMVALRKQRGHR